VISFVKPLAMSCLNENAASFSCLSIGTVI
jgi:hypothetical protein